MVNYRYCIVCLNGKENVRVKSEPKTMFKFPNSPQRKKKWMSKLRLIEEEIKSGARVCELHFRKSQFVRTNLKKGALPSLCHKEMSTKCATNPLPVLPSTVLVTSTQIQFPTINLPQLIYLAQPIVTMQNPSPLASQSPSNYSNEKSLDVLKRLDNIRSRRLLKQRQADRRRIKRLQAKVAELKAKLKERISIHEVFSANETFRDLVKSQIIRYTTKKRPYSDFEKTAALSLYYSCGPNGYQTMKKMGFKLPNRSTLQLWTRQFRINTGLNPRLFDCLKEATASFDDKEKDCIITWDEMSIKQFVEYNKYYDMFEGLEDLGSHRRTLEAANEVLVFMIRGVNANWKFPISFYFSCHATTSEMLDTLVTENITAVQNIGLKVRIGICDMSFTNQGLYRSWSISKSTPYKLFNDKRVYFVHDTPHLFKLIRNNLLNHYFIFREKIGNDSVERKIRWSHISTFYEKDTSTPSRMAPKLSPSHIRPKDYSKMKVRLATQVFSHSVYAGMMTMCAMKRVSKDYRHTAFFIKKVDEIFDFLNTSRFVNDKPGRCATNFYKDFYKFDEYIDFFEATKVPGMGKDPDFLKGLLLTLSGIKQLALDLKKQGYTHLFTRNIQQDCLENYFSFIRSKGGYCKNPTARSFRTNFRFLFFASLIHTPQSGNSEQVNEGLAKYVENMRHFMNSNNTPCSSPQADDEIQDLQINSKQAASFYSVRLARKIKLGTEHEAEVSSYMGAACIRAEVLRTKCSNCKKMLLKHKAVDAARNNKFRLIKFKEYDDSSNHLAYLRNEDCTVFQKINSMFLESACNSLTDSGINVLEGIFNRLQNNNCIKKWLANECSSHRANIVKYFLRAKIHGLIRDKNTKIRQIRAWNQNRRDMRNQ